MILFVYNVVLIFNLITTKSPSTNCFFGKNINNKKRYHILPSTNKLHIYEKDYFNWISFCFIWM